MKRYQIVLTILIGTCFAPHIHAAPLFKTNKATIACAGPGTEKLLFAAAHSQGGESISDRCHEIPKDYRFEAYQSTWHFDIKTKTSMKMVYGKNIGSEQFFWAAAEDTEPILDTSGNIVNNPCSFMPNGEIDRLEADATGRLYLKRYLVTSKCIDGEVKLTTKRLN